MKNKAVTLIELLVVLAIMFLLCAILAPVFCQAREADVLRNALPSSTTIDGVEFVKAGDEYESTVSNPKELPRFTKIGDHSFILRDDVTYVHDRRTCDRD